MIKSMEEQEEQEEQEKGTSTVNNYDHIKDHYDTITLAKEHLEKSRTMFIAVRALLEVGNPLEAKNLATIAMCEADMAANDFDCDAETMRYENKEAFNN